MDRPAIDRLYSYHTTPNGLRIVHISAATNVEYCGIATRVGSRDEDADSYGMAHFVEHTIFKGTTSRRSCHIINRMERIGGELNAYTTKEETYVYSIFPAGHLQRAVDLIADLAINSQFPDAELDKEREVVAEEIDSYLDSPSEAVYDDFEDLFYAGTPLGHNILGTTDALKTFNSSRCQEFLNAHYHAENMVFFYLGPQSADKVFKLVERYFAPLPSSANTRASAKAKVAARFDRRNEEGDNHQAHNIIGAEVDNLNSERRHTFALLNNILGGPGMNSRLNVELRERRGLVYTVDSSLSLYCDTGLLSIYFGCNPDDVDRCRRLIDKELTTLAETQLTQRALDTARKQYLGQLIVASASNEQTALSTARATLFHGRALTATQIIATINDITPSALREAATAIAPERCSILTLG
jgi:predicted Zn-dependent peptidase